ncbi:hypothetical protein PGT21_001000, partial [Puccinia graminis f. sp. tritici]
LRVKIIQLFHNIITKSLHTYHQSLINSLARFPHPTCINPFHNRFNRYHLTIIASVIHSTMCRCPRISMLPAHIDF